MVTDSKQTVILPFVFV